MGKKRAASAARDRVGVAGVQMIVSDDLNWIFREQATDDYGIDAQIEVVSGDRVTGKIVAAQIKSGPSYFKPTSGGWWFYVDADDIEYWSDHSLPVIVVLYDPRSKEAFWERVTPDAIQATRGAGDGKKILIPASKRLGHESRAELCRWAEGKPYDLRLRRLRLAQALMELLAAGDRRLLLEVDEWVNKSSGRGDVTLVSVDLDNRDRRQVSSGYIFAGLRPFAEFLPELYPWAELSVHDETYGPEFDWQRGDPPEVYQLSGGGLRPYANYLDEVDRWRLELKLNSLGRAFLEVDSYASERAASVG